MIQVSVYRLGGFTVEELCEHCFPFAETKSEYEEWAENGCQKAAEIRRTCYPIIEAANTHNAFTNTDGETWIK